MIRGLYTASAGMQVEQVRQEVIANNLANLNTSGFRRDLAVLEARDNMGIRRTGDPLRADPMAGSRRTAIGDLGTGVLVDRIVKRFEQGVLKQTDEPLDMAIDGDGYFTVAAPNGEKLYTRGGDFTRDAAGRIATKDGRLLLGANGPITLPPSATFNVTKDGIVAVNGRPVDRLALARFDAPDQDLEKVGDTAFRYRGAGNPPVSNALVAQGMLEGPNVNAVQEMVEMIAALRHYEANQKVLMSQDETLSKAVNDVARG